MGENDPAGLLRLARRMARRAVPDGRAASYDDAESDAALAVLLAARRHDPSRGVALAAYLSKVVPHRMVDLLRRRTGKGGRRLVRAAPGELPALPGRPDPPAECEAAEEVERLLRCLPGRHREVMRLWAGGLAQAEVAARLGQSAANVSRLMKQAIGWLREAHAGAEA